MLGKVLIFQEIIGEKEANGKHLTALCKKYNPDGVLLDFAEGLT